MKKALITGGTRGIGKALKNEFDINGYKTYSIARKNADLNLDLTILSNYKKIIKFIKQKKIEVVVLNAGFGASKRFEDYSDKELIEFINLNGIIKALIIKALFKEILNSKIRIAVTTSISGKLPSPLMAAYSSSKAYSSNLIDSINGELMCRGSKNFIMDISPGNIIISEQSEELKILAKKIFNGIRKNKRLIFSKEFYRAVIKKPQSDWKSFNEKSFQIKLERLFKKENTFVFDLDGTLISKETNKINGNINSLSKYKNRILSTSRSFERIPEFVLKHFDRVMTLNGAIYYEKGKIVKEFNTISKIEAKKVIDFAIKNKYNITFNSDYHFMNVSNKDSISFFEEQKIKWTSEIIIPNKIFLISLTLRTYVKKMKSSLNVARMSPRYVEYSNSDKGNVEKIVKDFIAIGDNENDLPMFAKSKSYIHVGVNVKYTEKWLKDFKWKM